MIHKKQKHADTIYQYLSKDLVLTSAQKLLLETVKDESFPGAIIPTEQIYYIVASSEKEWRLLLPMVKAFLSPSVIDASCAVKYLDEHNVVDKVLSPLGLKCVLKVPVPLQKIGGFSASKVYEKIFIRMYELYKQTAFYQVSYPEHTSAIVERFKNALKFQDTVEALLCMEKIKNEKRLDALNIIFMEIEYFYALQDWEGILEIDQLDQVIITRKPLRIRMHLIEAMYYVYIEKALKNTEHVIQQIQRYLLPLLSVPCPENAQEVVKSVYILASNHNLISSSMITKIVDSNVEIKGKETVVDMVSVRAAAIKASNDDTVEAIQVAQEQFDQLPEHEQDIVVATIVNDEIIEDIDFPLSWSEWLDKLSHEDFQVAREVAEKGLEEWSIQKQLNDPTVVKNLAQKILELNHLGVEKFIVSTPDFLEALYRDKNHPNPLYMPLFMSILTLISYNDIQDQKSLYVTQDITRVLLQLGPSTDKYKEVMEMVEVIVDKTNGKSYINWLLDYAELLISENASDLLSRNNLLGKILNKIYDQREYLEEFHLKLVLKLAAVIGIQDLFADVSFEEEVDTENPWEMYDSKTIGIYTLSENAARYAKEYLEEKIQNVKIILNHDKAATDALRNMAHVSDYLVLVTQSAKHAATGEIQKILRQKGKDPLFPMGKGSSSIISVLLKV